MESDWPSVARARTSSHAVVPAINALAVPSVGGLRPVLLATMERLEHFNRQYRETALAALLPWCEAAASSALEQLRAPFRHIAVARLADQSHSTGRLITANLNALEVAVQQPPPLTTESELAIHEALMRDNWPSQAGRIRDQTVWIGGHSPETAVFVPPDHTQVPQAFQDLEKFLQRTDLDPITHAAIAHAQYETIHPHTDGNGRTGRALVISQLSASGASPDLVIPISAGLIASRTSYIEALTQYRHGDPIRITEVFTFAIQHAIDAAQRLHQAVQVIEDDICASATRVTSNLQRIARLCTREPAFTVVSVTALGVPTASAYRLLQQLVTHEHLTPEPKIRGRSVWSVPALTTALDRFITRSSRE